MLCIQGPPISFLFVSKKHQVVNKVISQCAPNTSQRSCLLTWQQVREIGDVAFPPLPVRVAGDLDLEGRGDRLVEGGRIDNGLFRASDQNKHVHLHARCGTVNNWQRLKKGSIAWWRTTDAVRWQLFVPIVKARQAHGANASASMCGSHGFEALASGSQANSRSFYFKLSVN